MKILACVVLVWIFCGIYTWGTVMADLDYKDRTDWAILHEGSRDNIGISAAECLLGPMGSIAVAFVTNFNQHGWELWEKRERKGNDHPPRANSSHSCTPEA